MMAVRDGPAAAYGDVRQEWEDLKDRYSRAAEAAGKEAGEATRSAEVPPVEKIKGDLERSLEVIRMSDEGKTVSIPKNSRVSGLKFSFGEFRVNETCIVWEPHNHAPVSMA